MDYGVFAKFCEDLGLNCKFNEPMKNHTGFKTGGNADIFIEVGDTLSLSSLLETAKALKIPTFILGKGSNLLVSDKGIEGAVISLSGLDEIKIEGENVTAGAGASLTALCVAVAEQGLRGLEFAYGIPGTVGGGLFMNAGAYGGEMADVVTEAQFITPEGNMGVIGKSDMALGYRTSCFKENGNVITSVSFKLKKGTKDEITNQMKELMGKRRDKQPLEYPSAGSTFKRPEGHFAGALIEECELKGKSVGGAEVSQKHAGFVINKNGATTEDILNLMKLIKETVMEKKGVKLEPEVIFVGRE
ncbi:MAG: UDP-N-acetylmuramate dehydrogenase [Acutalibacteraceae bacterium]|nr:UDP-N-acetylmuramate dehydrogenase [Acutalibacteraceae bacterium]